MNTTSNSHLLPILKRNLLQETPTWNKLTWKQAKKGQTCISRQEQTQEGWQQSRNKKGINSALKGKIQNSLEAVAKAREEEEEKEEQRFCFKMKQFETQTYLNLSVITVENDHRKLWNSGQIKQGVITMPPSKYNKIKRKCSSSLIHFPVSWKETQRMRKQLNNGKKDTEPNLYIQVYF